MDFSKKGVEKKQKALVSKLPRNKRKLSVSLFKTLLVIFLAIIVLGIGSGFGMLKGILDDTPEVNAKDLIPKGYQTTLYDQDGKELMVLASFDANREYVYYDDIPSLLLKINVSGSITVSMSRVSCVPSPTVSSPVTLIRVPVH